ncbi:MAG: hypothetical protein Q9212_002413 [Teloschistes hypoglaucus]
MAPAHFVYISGYPGVDTVLTPSLTLTADFCRMPELLDSHTIIDAAATLYERYMPDYDPLRKHLVSHFTPEVLQAVDTRIQRQVLLTQGGQVPSLSKDQGLPYHRLLAQPSALARTNIISFHAGRYWERWKSEPREEALMHSIRI